MTDARPDPRAFARAAKRIVVKLGSRAVATGDEIYGRLAREMKRAKDEGRAVVLVSSGAIALGFRKLGFPTRPKEMARLQASAAAGQSLLMRAYEEAFAKEGLKVAQVLLTHADLADRVRANNARAAMAALLEAGAVPILNENDSVSVEEIKFGDNDQLAAMVAPLVDADLLVLLSDVEGLLDGDGNRVPVVTDPAAARALVRPSASDVGTGGMASKIEAARRATLAGATAIVADARDEAILSKILAGDDVGTLFAPAAERLSARKHWIAYTLRPRGALVLDRGAADAVATKGKSVLSVGVLGVRGDFRTGDAVRLMDPDGVEIGRGLAKCGAADAAAVAGKGRADLPPERAELAEIVSRDDLALV